MSRAHFITYALDEEGRPIAGATVSVRDKGTTTLISETVYAEDDPSSTEKGNPFTSDADGAIELWLENPDIVDLYVTKTGYPPKLIRVAVTQLVPSELVVKGDGATATQRAALNFTNGFILSDDAGNDETEIAPNYGESGDLVAITFGATADAGSGDEIARASHRHPAPANPVTAHLSAFTHENIAATVAGLASLVSALAAHIADTSDSHDASSISVADVGTLLAAGDVEAALAEIIGFISAHIADTSDAHDASSISVADVGTLLTATDAEAAFAELATALAAHLADLENAHDAEAIDFDDPGSDYTSTNVESALQEVMNLLQAHTPSFHDAGICQLRKTNSQSVADATDVAVVFNAAAEVTDTDTFHDGTTNNTRITIPAALNGKKVRLRAQVNWSSDADGNRAIWIQHSASTVVVGRTRQFPAANAFDQQVTTPLITVATGDYFELYVRHNGGSGITVEGHATDWQTWLELVEEG